MKSFKNRKLKGSVLLTVVSVMALLIIFLFGTLVLATAANNRAHINYSTAQTNITARTIVKTAFDAIEHNKDYADAMDALSSTNKTLDIPVTISSNSTNVSTLGHVDSLTAEYMGTRKFYNKNRSKWDDCTVIRIAANVTMNGITTTSCAYVVKDPPEPPGDGGGGGAGFVTTGGAGFPSQVNLYGGSYLGIPKKEDCSLTKFKYLEDFGKSAADSSYLSGNDFSFVNSLSLMEADVVVNGNFSAGNLSKIVYPGKGRGITIWGDCDFSDSSFGNINEIKVTNLGTTGDINFKDIPFFYVDGEFKGSIKSGPQNTGKDASNNVIAAAPDNEAPFNTFAGNINVNEAKFSVTGDLYLMNPNKTNTLKPKDDAKLYSWTYSVVNKSGDNALSKVSGDIYSKGKMNISGQKKIYIGGLYIDNDLELGMDTGGGLLDINGDLVVNGDITGSLSNGAKAVVHGNVYAKSSTVEFENPTGGDVAVKNISEFKSDVYPKYAERDVLLGLNATPLKDNSGNDIEIKDSQVVMRMDQVLDKVIDPYKNSVLPPTLESKRTSATIKKFTTLKEIKKTEGVVCKGWYDTALNKVKLDYQPITAADAEQDSNKDWPVIKEDCVISMGENPWAPGNFMTPFSNGSFDTYGPEIGFGDGKKGMRAVVFNPGEGDMLVVLDGVSFDNSVNIIVDDSKGGTVYFYVNGGTSDTNRKTSHFEGCLYTTKYLDLFMKMENGVDLDTSIGGTQDSIQIYTDAKYKMPYDAAHSSNPVPYNAACLGLNVLTTSQKNFAPGAKIYAAPYSDLTWDNFVCCMAQIVSPNVKLRVNSTSGQNDVVSDKKIYYNGDLVNDFPKQPDHKSWDDIAGNQKFKYILGCCNSETTYFQNQVNMLFIPDESGATEEITLPDATHWFKIMYYDEY